MKTLPLNSGRITIKKKYLLKHKNNVEIYCCR